MRVYLLWHMRPVENVEGVDRDMVYIETEDKLCGVFSTKEVAESARANLIRQPGFRDYPDDFEINAYELDKIHWEDGFVTEEW
ncbi:hypothetical protein DQ237_14035 [Blastococcus sp. TF02-8]|nr:hypothetical protein DQ237_14035 [Blastococcus sp. TF02-8]